MIVKPDYYSTYSYRGNKKQMFIENQKYDPIIDKKEPSNYLLGEKITDEDRRINYKLAVGAGVLATTTKLGFAYLGGLMQARNQFIPGNFYFLNSRFNWISSLKYVVPCYFMGYVVSIFAFGKPVIAEDIFRSKLRKLGRIEKENKYNKN